MQARRGDRIHESAVSEVLGAVMLIAVVVTAIAIIGVALTSQPAPEKIPAIDAIISSNGRDTIRIFNNGGDSLTSQQVAVLVDGIDRTSSFTIQGAAWSTWSPGQFLDYNYGALPAKVQLIYKSPSTQTVLVSADFSSGMPTHVPTAVPTPGTPAIVTGIIPGIGISGSSLSAAISGSGFQPGAVVHLVHGSDVIPASSVMVISQNSISCSFSLTGAVTGLWDVVVTNPSSPAGTLTRGFTVIPVGPPPTVIRISPVSGNSGDSVNIRNLTGTGFVGGASVILSRYGSGDLYAQNVNVMDSNNISCTFVLPPGTATGSWDVTVRNTDGQSGTFTNSFTVVNPGPAVTGITPAAAYTGTSVSITRLAGTGFMSGATVKLNGTSDPSGIMASDVAVISQNQITCVFDLAGAPPGVRNVVVTNSDGKSAILPDGFTVAGYGPIVTAINPTSGITGLSYSPVSIGGNGFIDGATIKLSRAGSPDISTTGVNVASPNFISCALSLPSGAAVGPWNVVVTNPDGQNGTLAGGFTIRNQIVSIGAITGTPQVGSVLTAGTLSPPGATAGYQWESATVPGGPFSAIAGAASASYIPVAGDYGLFIRVNASGIGNYTGTVFSSSVGPVARIPITAIGPVAGTPQVGSVLTAGALTPSGATVTYQWQRSTTFGGTYSAIAGATAFSYTPVAGDAAYYVRVIATGSGGYTGTVTSTAAGPVTKITVTAIGATTGTPQVGSTLTAGALTPAGATVTYQWQRSTTSGGTYSAISGASAATYVPVASYLGNYLRVVATGTGAYTGTVTSIPVGPVTTPIIAIGSITGTAQVGSVLTRGALTPAAATVNNQWERSSSAGGTYSAIPGATASTYTPVTSDIGYYLHIVSTGTGSYTGTITSASRGPVTAIPITAIGAISGTLRSGRVLTAGALTPTAATVTYQWQRSSTSGGSYSAIPGATATTYTLAAGDVGYYIRVVATGTGSYSGTVTSTVRGPVTT